MSKRVLVAMSGGVDSSAAAAVLLEKGYDVEGAIMLLSPCDDGSAVNDAKYVADKLKIKLHVFDFRDEFKSNVIADFSKTYCKGMTPNPCVICNKKIKFGVFLDKALEMGFDLIATGHYAKIEQNKERYSLYRTNSAKDQTYVLYNLNQRILKHVIFPLSEIEDKTYVRNLAQKLCPKVAAKPDSQEICFIPDDDYSGFIKSQGVEMPQGNFVDLNGNVLGTHKGIFNYTVGQRKGLGISLGKPQFVVKIDTQRNEVVLGDNSDTFSTALEASELNFISGATPEAPVKLTAKVRYSAKDVPVTLAVTDGIAKVEFDSPERAITPGQAIVFYDNDEVIGGGTIIRSLS